MRESNEFRSGKGDTLIGVRNIDSSEPEFLYTDTDSSFVFDAHETSGKAMIGNGGGGEALLADEIRALIAEMSPPAVAVVGCQHCGQPVAAYTVCKYCGAPTMKMDGGEIYFEGRSPIESTAELLSRTDKEMREAFPEKYE